MSVRSSSASPPSDEEVPHDISGDLKIPAKDANAKDDPALYYYWVHVLELEKDKSHEKSKSAAAKSAENEVQMIGSLMEVQCGVMRYVLLTVRPDIV